HNLAWKLAFVLAGHAGDVLLDTYEVERRPVARAVAELAGRMNDERGLIRRPGLGTLWTMRKVLPYLVMGYGYASDGIALEDGACPGPGTTDLRGRPGTRVPHMWLERNGGRLSTLDLLGKRAVLFTAAPGAAWVEAATHAAAHAGIELDCARIGVDVHEIGRPWHTTFGVRRNGAVLARPDGFVCWRARRWVPDAAGALTRALDRLLAKPSPNPTR